MKGKIQPLVQVTDEWLVASDEEPDAVIGVDPKGQADAGAEPRDRGDVPPPLQIAGPPRMRALEKPTASTKLQRELHECSHLAYEPWCRFCAMSRGQNDPHRKLKKHVVDNTVPTVSADFGFLTRAGESKSNPFLVAREHQSRVVFNHQGRASPRQTSSTPSTSSTRSCRTSDT